MEIVSGEGKEKEGAGGEELRKKKRGRRPKNEREEYRLNKEQCKFYVDLTKDKESLNEVFNLLEASNKKEFGREITFKDIALFGIGKIAKKDIEKIQELSLSKMEKVEKHLADYNKKNETNMELAEFLIKKLSIS